MDYKIPLAKPTFGSDEILEAIRAMTEGRFTMGERTFKAEDMWSRWLGVKHTILVSSGSMANLLALVALRIHSKRDTPIKVITPALTWATTVFPIVQTNSLPVFLDVRLDTLNINEAALKNYANLHWASSPYPNLPSFAPIIMPIHFLGNPCNMDLLLEAKETCKGYLLEDACEAPGAMWKGRKVGTFGDLSTFSFFYSHHLTSMGEGGAICTDNEELAEICRSLRNFGNIRQLRDRDKIAEKYSLFDKRHIFLYVGYNAKMTDVQAAFLIHQIPKLNEMIKERQGTCLEWDRYLVSNYSKWLRTQLGYAGKSENPRMGFPLLVKSDAPFSKNDLTSFLESKGIETRQLEVGNIVEQPVAQRFKYEQAGDLPNARYALRNGFFIGCNGLTDEEKQYVVDAFDEFFKRYEK